MPIYEFKCLKCNECFEILFTSSQDTAELKCAKCDSQEVERVLSSTNFSVSSGSGGYGRLRPDPQLFQRFLLNI